MPQKSRPDPANGTVVTADEYEGIALGFAEDGMIGNATDPTVVYADSTGRQVKIRAGRIAQIRGYTWFSDPTTDEIVPTLPANTSGNPRIDRLVLRLDRAARTVRTVYLQGTPSANPVAPTFTTNVSLSSGTLDLPLARWTCANGYTTVAAADLVNEAWYPQQTGVITCTSSSRPFSVWLYEGMKIYETDTNRTYTWNGAGWQPDFPYVCTSTSRPTGAGVVTGLQIYESDTDLTWVWDGGVWDPVSTSIVCTSTTRPTGTSRFTGVRIYETDTDQTWIWDGAAWDPVSTRVLCTAGTRPTGTARWVGLEIYETDTTRTYRWDGTYWRQATGTVVFVGYFNVNTANLDNGDRIWWVTSGWSPPYPGTYRIRTRSPFDGVHNEEVRVDLNVNHGSVNAVIASKVVKHAYNNWVGVVDLESYWYAPNTSPPAIHVHGWRIYGGSFYYSRGTRWLEITYEGPNNMIANS